MCATLARVLTVDNCCPLIISHYLACCSGSTAKKVTHSLEAMAHVFNILKKSNGMQFFIRGVRKLLQFFNFIKSN